MKIKLLNDIKSLLNAPHDTAKGREALSKALTGRVLPDLQPETDKEKEK